MDLVVLLVASINVNICNSLDNHICNCPQAHDLDGPKPKIIVLSLMVIITLVFFS